ncbi:hypothetical protein I862_04240 [endosymbiont of Acanthamoeba sp. UWC8]|uniref:DUF2793 domain-containing protein n=1 Tax=endosymbiont of Acanthamoeba sp. UWC8 TaxID=86106 RepID=UPI0004D0E9F5|nr:DUF2793 domain-containing protein [endosymbiont of Acanthamoeba sp. UWC8]AIF81408.1 hypothetical protein I862_04240 [endosymbiont of Acanthamoeba sp. UWC8]
MNNTTPRLGLPYILQSQSQKEVTHNEALNILDVLTQSVVEDINLNNPPDNPSIGKCWIIGESPVGAWQGKEKHIAQAGQGGSWFFTAPFKMLKVWVEASEQFYTYNGLNWVPEGVKKASEFLSIEQKDEKINLLGTSVDTNIKIPKRALVIAVNTWVHAEVKGVSSFNVGVPDEKNRYGDKIGISLNTTNIGVSYHPIAYYNDTPVRVAANDGKFSGGSVQITIQYFKPRGAWNWE